MEIHNDISGVNLRRAHAELDHYYKIETSDIQKRIHENDGMTIKIIQDGFLDNIINTFDRRRIVLEKKADILSEYYGDSLRTKDLIKDYYSYKRVISGAANLTSAGILFANIYTKFAKNSVFFGALGTIASITAAQCLGRYLTNNWLERHVERNWKIHTTRMSKGNKIFNNKVLVQPILPTTRVKIKKLHHLDLGYLKLFNYILLYFY